MENEGSSTNLEERIKELELTQKALRESEERFRSLLTNIPGAIYRIAVDPTWTMHFISNVIEDISGYPASDFMQNKVRTYASIIHPDDREMTERTVHEGLKLREPYIIEYRIINADGSVHWVCERGQGDFGDGSEVLWLEGIIFEITRRKRIEKKLKQNENLLRQIFDTTPNCVFLKDRNGMYLVVNKRMAELHNTTPEELAGKHDYEIAQKWFETIDYEEFRKSEFDIINSEDKLFTFEEPFIYNDGTVRWFKTLKIPFEMEDNQNCLLVISNDITERKQTEEELQKYRQQLEELVEGRTAELHSANKDLEAFAYSVSHDLRAPLRAINGFTRILMEDYVEKLDAEGKRLGGIIQHNTQKMGTLIDDLLTFSRMGRAAMHFTEIDMKNMVHAIFHEVTSKVERKRIEFNVSDLPRAVGDTTMMRQLWVNLISNAIKFSAHRKQAVISIFCLDEENRLTYCTKDNGVGFDMNYMDKLFGVFQRLHSSKEFEGTGVGLALVQRIIHRHGGEVWANSELDHGAAFYFSLPKRGAPNNET